MIPMPRFRAMSVAQPYDLSRAVEMCGIYYRGEAFLAAHKNKEAAAEFQRILDHPGIRSVSPYFALAHLGIARALRAQGDVAGARAEYGKFFELWKAADPDLPILLEARQGSGGVCKICGAASVLRLLFALRSDLPRCAPALLV